ncbi:hypothetical protein BJF83_21335 [Nocardiopsis sp. CNR-923]|uniref:hypothetical protein n=1 Tax=Nocardiopsis sp. CNR-923 TaxID=1904965 RepID=UPI0009674361|nr:hypothetical protein [Nocardiopsis sp. CNR-923]OLT26347.1 hypothetical protein BJF83_21335 [Nocardiopsis sp. CNR-923]
MADNGTKVASFTPAQEGAQLAILLDWAAHEGLADFEDTMWVKYLLGNGGAHTQPLNPEKADLVRDFLLDLLTRIEKKGTLVRSGACQAVTEVAITFGWSDQTSRETCVCKG